MHMVRRAILALALIAGIGPAIAQVPPPVPALPDAERRISYSITGSTCACSLGANLNLYGDSTDFQSWVEVYLNGVLVNYNDPAFGWTITSQSGTPLANLSRPITDGLLTFTNPQTGIVQIVGAERPRRTSTFSENQPVPARNINQALNYIIASLREVWDKINDVTGRVVRAPPGETLSTLPPAANRANMGVCFDSGGNLVPCVPVTSGSITAGNGIALSGSNPTTITNNIQAGAGVTLTGTNPIAISVVPVTAVAPPSGRLTLISGVPEMNADVVGGQNVYYAPDGLGNSVPIYNGASMLAYQFTSSNTDQVGLTLNLGGASAWAAGTIYDVFAVLNSGVPVLATRVFDSAMLPSAPAQIANNTAIQTGTSPGSWTNPGNAFNGVPNQNTANSAVLTSNNSIANCLGQDFGSANASVVTQIVVSAPSDNALIGSSTASLPVFIWASNDNTNWTIFDERNINASASATVYTFGINNSLTVPYRYIRVCFQGDGTHSIKIAQMQFFTTAAPSTRRLTKFNGLLTNDATITARINSTATLSVPVNQATYLGSILIDPASTGQVSAYVTPGPSRVYNIWNAYNQRGITVQAVVPGTITGVGSTSYALSNTVWNYIQNTNTFSLTALIGYAYEPMSVKLNRNAYFNTTTAGIGYQAGIGLDSNNNMSGIVWDTTVDSSGSEIGLNGEASLSMRPFFGTHTFYGLESALYTSAGTLSLFPSFPNTVMTANWKG